MVAAISKKIEERRLLLGRHMRRREEPYIGIRVLEMEAHGARTRHKPKRRRMDCVRQWFSDGGPRTPRVRELFLRGLATCFNKISINVRNPFDIQIENISNVKYLPSDF